MLMRFRLRSLVTAAFAVATVGLPSLASADPVTLTVSEDTSLQQLLNHPCVIGDSSCNNPATFQYTLLPPNKGAGTFSSPEYTVQELRDLIGGDSFTVGLDLNQALGQNTGTYDLIQFTMSVNGTVVFSTLGGSLLMPVSPGNGFSDAAIAGFSLAGLAPTDKIVFTTMFANDTGGREQYFIQGPAGSPVSATPEPASMVLLGTGLAGLVFARRRKSTPGT